MSQFSGFEDLFMPGLRSRPSKPKKPTSGGSAGIPAKNKPGSMVNNAPNDKVKKKKKKKKAEPPPLPKRGMMKGLGRLMGPFFVGMIANDILKQVLGHTEGARQEKMGEFMAGEEALEMMGTPDDLTTRRELASLMGGLADYEGAKGNPIYDRIL